MYALSAASPGAGWLGGLCVLLVLHILARLEAIEKGMAENRQSLEAVRERLKMEPFQYSNAVEKQD